MEDANSFTVVGTEALDLLGVRRGRNHGRLCEKEACGLSVQGVRWGRSECDGERGRVAAGNCGGREGYILMGEMLRKGE